MRWSPGDVGTKCLAIIIEGLADIINIAELLIIIQPKSARFQKVFCRSICMQIIAWRGGRMTQLNNAASAPRRHAPIDLSFAQRLEFLVAAVIFGTV